MSVFTENVKTLMSEKKLSQKELSRLSHVSEASLCRYLNGSIMPRDDIIMNISNALSVSFEYLKEGRKQSQKEDSYSETVRVVARNRRVLTKQQKAEIISVLYGESDYEGD